MAISGALVVGQDTEQRFTDILKQKISQLKIGPYTEDDVDFGPVISQQSKETIISYIDGAVTEGANLVIDGRNPKVCETSNGFYVGPTLLNNITPDMTIFKEEVFGPARIVVGVETLQEAIELINDHELGNGVTMFTSSGAAARKFQEEIEVGMVGVNVPIPIPVGYHNLGDGSALSLVKGICLVRIKRDFLQRLKQSRSVGQMKWKMQQAPLPSQVITMQKANLLKK